MSDTPPEVTSGFISRAIALAVANVASGEGGPFGAVIVRDNVIIAESANRVLVSGDPTAHAEIEAIRLACRALDSIELRDCVMYASCEPCPMCLGAIYWARIARVYYAASRDDAAEFDDAHIYRELSADPETRTIPMQRIPHSQTLAPFTAWSQKTDRRPY